MSHRYIELFLNSTGGSSGMSLGGIGNFCGGMHILFGTLFLYYIITSLVFVHFYRAINFMISLTLKDTDLIFPLLGLGNNFRPGYSPNRGFSSQLGGSNYNSF